MSAQLSIDTLHPCPACGGLGQRPDPETDGWAPCLVCEATGTVPWDPADPSIPIGLL